jgi:transcriptional regulator with XRE-family HTH domain
MPHDPPTEALEPTTDDPSVVAPHQPGYSRVSPAQATEIVRIKRVNPKATLEQIAAAIGVKSISTVSYWLRELDNDTVQEARKHAKTNALRASMKLVDQIDADDPRVSQGAAKAITALAGVQEGTAQVQVGVQVIVGTGAAPAGSDPFDNLTIDAHVVKPVD